MALSSQFMHPTIITTITAITAITAIIPSLFVSYCFDYTCAKNIAA